MTAEGGVKEGKRSKIGLYRKLVAAYWTLGCLNQKKPRSVGDSLLPLGP